MPTSTPNFGLPLYNNTTDSSQAFSDYREAISGTPLTSAMNKIDLALKAQADGLAAIAKGAFWVPASAGTPNTYVATGVPGLGIYSSGTAIVLSVNVANTGSSTLNINSIGVFALYKISPAGAYVALSANDLVPGRLYLFVYNGYYWVSVANTTGDQIAMQGSTGDVAILASNKSLTTTTQSLVVSGASHAAAAKTTPVNADEFPMVDSEAANVLKRITFSDLKTAVTTSTDWATTTHAAASKNPPVDADELGLVDSAASFGLKKLTWANVKSTLNAVYDWATVAHAATSKTTPVDADELSIVDSAAANVIKRLTWANLKATLNAVYDWATVTHAATSKATPVDADELSIVDSAASNVIKRLTWANLKTTLNSLYDWATVTFGATAKTTVVDADLLSIVDSAASNVIKKVSFADLKTSIGSSDWAATTHAASSKTTPVDADELGLVDSAASFGLKKLTWANLSATLNTNYGFTTGWVKDLNTWTYSSADAPTFVVSVNADMTGILVKGMRIKVTQTTDKYFLITGVGAYSAGATPITIYGGTDYTLTSGTITAAYYSSMKAPFGFPIDTEKWSVIVSDTTQRSQASPTQNTWYNLGSISITIPIGIWKVSYDVHGQLVITATQTSVNITLSTANNSESDTDFTTTTRFTAASSGTWNIVSQMQKSKQLIMASKTTYYLNTQTITASGTTLYNRNDLSKLYLIAECPYL